MHRALGSFSTTLRARGANLRPDSFTSSKNLPNVVVIHGISEAYEHVQIQALEVRCLPLPTLIRLAELVASANTPPLHPYCSAFRS